MKVEFLSAVLLVSKDAERLARFYRDVVGIPLEDEEHGGSQKHFGCELGDVHFAIHPLANFPTEGAGVGSVKLAFEVFDMKAFLEQLRSHGIDPLFPPKPLGGIGMLTALRDPDGNYVEFTQLSEKWYAHLENRRREGHDVLAHARGRNSAGR